jgi:hypothetical protein
MGAFISFIIGFIFPRLLTLILLFFTNWFYDVFDTKIWPIVGFLFIPSTMLWYSAVENWFYGDWGMWQLMGLVIAILIDLMRTAITLDQ